MEGLPLICLQICIKVGKSPKDTAALVVMNWQHVSFPVTSVDSKERGDNGIKSDLKVLSSCCRVLVDSRQVVMTRKIDNEVDAVIIRLVAVPQIKVTIFKILSVMQELFTQRVIVLSFNGCCRRVERWKILI